MPISEIPIFSMLRTKMQWHQERQRVLADNVANADTPNFRPSDLAPVKFDQKTPVAQNAVALARTDAGHIAGGAPANGAFPAERRAFQEVRPAGNAVTLEDQMLKVAANQMDYQAVTTLYTRSLGLLKSAIGKR